MLGAVPFAQLFLWRDVECAALDLALHCAHVVVVADGAEERLAAGGKPTVEIRYLFISLFLVSRRT